MLPQQYCLRWKYHHSNLQTQFSQLLDRGCFCDVTLACDGQTLKAHRVVLSACSTYFDSILTNCNSEKDPIIILKDVKFQDIKYLVEFMYKGEINVEHSNLASLLKTAEELRIKGLAEVSWRDDDQSEPFENNDNNNNITHSTPNGHHYPAISSSQQQSMAQSSALIAAAVSNQRGIYDDKENLFKPLPFLTAIPPLSSPKDLSSRKKRGRPPLDESNHFTRAPKFAHLTSNEHNMYESEIEQKNDPCDLSATATSTSSTTTTSQSLMMHPGNLSETAAAAAHLEQQMNGHTSKKHIKYTNSALPNSLVTVMMDEKSHDDEKSFYLPFKSGEPVEFDEAFLKEAMAQKFMPKIERPDTPSADLVEEEDDSILCSPAEHLQSIFLTSEEREEWKDVIRMNDYLTKGRRPQFWEEPFTKRVLDAIKNKNLEMKKAAKLLGVSYGTLYGRYRETYGCLKHPYRGPAGSYHMVSRMRDMWPGSSDDQADLMNLVHRQQSNQNLMDIVDIGHRMIADENILDQMPSSLAKSYTSKMFKNMNNLTEMGHLLNVSKVSPTSSNNSTSSRSDSPNTSSLPVSVLSASAILTPVGSSLELHK